MISNETTKIPERTEDTPGVDLAKNFSDDNASLFTKMSEAGKRTARSVYERIYKIPGVNRIVAKLEIVYQQKLADKNEGKAIKTSKKLESIDAKIADYENSKKRIEIIANNLKQKSALGAEKILDKVKCIEKKKDKLINKREDVIRKLNEKRDALDSSVDKRDSVVNRLADYYSGKIEPMERELEGLQKSKNRLALHIIAENIKQEEKISKLNAIVKDKEELKNAYEELGMSERQIRRDKDMKKLEELLTKGFGNIKKREEKLIEKISKINNRIEKVEKKSAPYRSKLKEFLRIKNRQYIKVQVPEEKEVAQDTTPQEQPTLQDTVTAEDTESVEDDGKATLKSYIVNWNAYLKEKYGEDNSNRDGVIINSEEFSREISFKADDRLDFVDFKKLLIGYYRSKKNNLSDKTEEEINGEEFKEKVEKK